jgi:hypothetical protein
MVSKEAGKGQRAEAYREWWTVSRAASETAVCENTIRRHLKRFREFLKARKVSGTVRIPPDTVEALKEIVRDYDKGLRVDEVRARLLTRYRPQYETEAAPPTDLMQGQTTGVSELAKALSDLAALAVDQRAALERLETRNTELEGKLKVLEAELIAGKQRAREFERSVEAKLRGGRK